MIDDKAGRFTHCTEFIDSPDPDPVFPGNEQPGVAISIDLFPSCIIRINFKMTEIRGVCPES